MPSPLYLDLRNDRAIRKYASFELLVDGLDIDLTNYDTRSSLRRIYSSEVVADFSIDLVAVTIPAAVRLKLNILQTAALAPGRYVWDLVASHMDTGDTYRLREGIAIVLPGVTDVSLDVVIPTPSPSPTPTPPQVDRVKVPFSWGDASPKPIHTVPAGKLLTTAQIVITTPFNGVGAALTLGDAADSDRLITTLQVSPAEVGEYETNPNYVYPSDTQVQLTINPGLSGIQGSGFVLLEFD